MVDSGMTGVSSGSCEELASDEEGSRSVASIEDDWRKEMTIYELYSLNAPSSRTPRQSLQVLSLTRYIWNQILVISSYILEAKKVCLLWTCKELMQSVSFHSEIFLFGKELILPLLSILCFPRASIFHWIYFLSFLFVCLDSSAQLSRLVWLVVKLILLMLSTKIWEYI